MWIWQLDLNARQVGYFEGKKNIIPLNFLHIFRGNKAPISFPAHTNTHVSNLVFIYLLFIFFFDAGVK